MNVITPSTVLTAADRYLLGQVSLDVAADAEIRRMKEERLETSHPTLNIVIRLVTVILFVPLLLIGLLSPRRWTA